MSPPPNDHNVLFGRQNPSSAFQRCRPRSDDSLRKKVHREVDALQFAARDVQIPRMFGAPAKQDRIELALEIVHRHRTADVSFGHKLHAFGLHLIETPIEMRFSILNSGMP